MLIVHAINTLYTSHFLCRQKKKAKPAGHHDATMSSRAEFAMRAPWRGSRLCGPSFHLTLLSYAPLNFGAPRAMPGGLNFLSPPPPLSLRGQRIPQGRRVYKGGPVVTTSPDNPRAKRGRDSARRLKPRTMRPAKVSPRRCFSCTVPSLLISSHLALLGPERTKLRSLLERKADLFDKPLDRAGGIRAFCTKQRKVSESTSGRRRMYTLRAGQRSFEELCRKLDWQSLHCVSKYKFPRPPLYSNTFRFFVDSRASRHVSHAS